MKEHYFIGKLILDENDINRMNYIVSDLVDNNSQKSITDLLDKIYNSNNTINKLIRVIIKPFNSNIVYGKFQSLCIKKDKFGIHSYHIGEFPLENKLFELVGSNVEMWLEDYTDATGDVHNGKTS